jgi:acetate kinase
MRGHVERIGAGLIPSLRLDGGEPVALAGEGHAAMLAELLALVILPRAGRVRAVGHRVVHGGLEFAGPVLVTGDVRDRIAALAPLAPAHQPHNVAGIDAVSAALPGVPQVACFDTAFHRTIPEHRQLMPLPRRFTELRRFGFHGLSYQHVAGVLPGMIGARGLGRVVVCHLGNGCSLAGIEGGSVNTRRWDSHRSTG